MTAESKSFCSVCSKAAGIAPGGTGWATDRFIILELPLPWPEDPLEARSAPVGLQQTMLGLWDDEAPIGLFGVAPDPAYSIPGKTRVLSFDFRANPGGPAQRCDYLMPVELVADSIDSLARRNTVPAGVEVDATLYHDAMICTHGSRDACCATFGFPLYRTLRSKLGDEPNVRIWRATHFGGHRFAPTMMTFPDGRSWGYLDGKTGLAILERDEPAADILHAYRGWSGYADDALQLLEQEAFARFGWEWLSYRQHGRIIASDEESGTRHAEIVAVSPGGDAIEIRGEIVCVDHVAARGSCDGEDHPNPRYAVRNVEFLVSPDLVAVR